MSDITEKTAQMKTAAATIQDLQTAYDQDGWKEWNKNDFEKLRHIQLHLARTLGKFATVCHNLDHVSNEGKVVDFSSDKDASNIVADLIHHASQIASIYGLEIGDCVINRYKENAARFCPESDFAKL